MSEPVRDTCLAIIDILGFSNMVRSQRDVERFKERYMSVLTAPEVREKARGLDIDYEVFSDTVIVGAGDNTATQQIIHVLSFCRFLWTWAVVHDFPLRGAMAYGTVLWGEDVKVGVPIIEAARAEKLQEWIGIMVCPSVLAVLDQERRETTESLKEHHMVLTDIPIKPAQSFRGYALRPDSAVPGASLEDLCCVLNRQLLLCEELNAQLKYRNALKLLEACSTHGQLKG